MSDWILWLLALGLLALVIGLGVYVIRFAMADWKRTREREARMAEQQRENKAFSLTLQRAIWRGQEWEIDVSDLRAAKDAFDFAWKSEHALQAYQMRVGTSLGLAFIALLVGLPFTGGLVWGMLVPAGVALVLFGWAFVRWGKYRRFKKAVLHVQAELERRASL